ncbi:IST1 homolog isoform X2 [Condylostylus longicornis]|uniref:IST1 homolog isoform X2 n=1 Tax=Condylostylus longicornis TaxID=2530218 RepID=UPI00244DE2DA|nr:IST1 homolog isoform X2 [Condylostylus longicornis]
MFSSGPNYTKLKTHLRLAVNRLKLLEKKKAELTQKARKEIADSIASNKVERAKIRVEHIIREDYLIEAMEIVEMYCDLLLARFGLITQMKELDDGIAEAVSSLVWVCPRLQSDVSELKVISDIFINKYGKDFAEHSRTATGNHRVSEKLMSKLAIQAPPKLLVEKYLIEIANNYSVEYEPDPEVMKEDLRPIGLDNFLIDLSDKNNLGGGPQPPQMGFIGYPQPPQLPNLPEPPNMKPFNYPGFGNGGGGGNGNTVPNAPFAYNIPPNVTVPENPQENVPEKKDLNINTKFINEETNKISNCGSGSPDDNQSSEQNKPKPQPRTKFTTDDSPSIYPTAPSISPSSSILNLPNVPLGLPEAPSVKDDDEIDFDDLTRRFEELKKKK